MESQESANALVSVSEIQRELALAKSIPELRLLDGKLTAMEALFRKMSVTLDVMNELAEARVRAARRLGQALTKTVRRGRSSADSGLPNGITRNESSRLQAIARMTDTAFEAAIADAKLSGRALTFASMLRAARAKSSGAKSQARAASSRSRTPGLGHELWETLARCLAPDAVSGVPRLSCFSSVRRVGIGDAGGLTGRAIVGATKSEQDVVSWIQVLASKGGLGLDEFVLVFDGRSQAAWAELETLARCAYCLGRVGDSITDAVIAYSGPKRHGFCLAFDSLGVVLERPKF